MRIALNKIDFEIEAVTAAEREGILRDASIAPAVWREVFRWDHAKAAGEVVTKGVTAKGQLILPNGVLFYVAKADGSKAEGPSRAMSKRVLEALGAKSAIDILRALASVVQIPQIKVPRDPYKPVEGDVSYALRMYTEYALLRLRNAGRNLSFVVALPGQCIFHHEITAKGDGYDTLVADRPELATIQPRFILAPTSDANRNMRALALSAWLNETQKVIAAKTADGAKLDDRALESAFGRMLAEFKVLTKGARPAATAARA